MTHSEFFTASAVLWCSAGERGHHIPPDVRALIQTFEGQRQYCEALLEEERAGHVARVNDLVVINPHAPEAFGQALHDYVKSLQPADPQRARLLNGLCHAFQLHREAGLKSVLAAASGQQFESLWELPEKVRTSTLGATGNVKTAQTAQAAVRRAMVDMGSKGQLSMAFPACWVETRKDMEARALEAFRQIYLDGEQPTYDRVGRLSGLSVKQLQGLFAKMEARRILSRVDNIRGIGRVPRVVNPSRIPTGATTLADVVDYMLHNKALSPDTTRAARTALLRHFNLQPHAPLGDLLKTCAAVPVDSLTAFPEAVEKASLQRGDSKRSARNNAWAVRSVLKLGLDAQIIPMVFSIDWLDDPWEVTKEKWLPTSLAADLGVKPGLVHQWRLHWGYAAHAARELFGKGIRPEDLGTDHVQQLARYWKARGRRNYASRVRQLFRALAERELGPLAGSTTVRPDPWFVYGRQGEGAETLEEMLAIMRHHTLPSEWGEFLKWYWDWATLPDDTIELADERFPLRPEKRELSAGTLKIRCSALRLLLGISSNHMKLDLRTLDLEHALGFGHVKQVIGHAQRIWRMRAEIGDVETSFGGALKNYVIGIGMFAEALYRRRQHARGAVQSLADMTRSRQKEMGQPKADDENELWRAYDHALTKAESLEKKARRVGNPNNTDTVKDLRRIIENTPATYWLRFLDDLLVLANRSIAEDGVSPAHHKLIRNAYLTAFVISTGFRWEELLHVRLDVDYVLNNYVDGPDRKCRLKYWNRKNDKEHVGVVREELVPLWLERHYLEVTRPALMAPIGGVNTHHHLFVRLGSGKYPSGRAFGCTDEMPEGQGRDPKALDNAKNSLRQAWQDWAGSLAYEWYQKEIPTGHGEWSGHAIRNAMAHAIMQAAKADGLSGEIAAANYLGDAPDSVLDTYGAIGGDYLDSELFGRLRGVARECGVADSSTVAAELERLRAEIEAKDRALQEARQALAEMNQHRNEKTRQPDVVLPTEGEDPQNARMSANEFDSLVRKRVKEELTRMLQGA